MSLPALNTVSWPWNTTTRTLASARACSMPSASAAYMSLVIEFFLSVRLKVRVMTPASVCKRMSDMQASTKRPPAGGHKKDVRVP